MGRREVGFLRGGSNGGHGNATTGDATTGNAPISGCTGNALQLEVEGYNNLYNNNLNLVPRGIIPVQYSIKH